ncbi:hypothetical protein L1I79_28165 [Strepomyces sp. STD 3.1]|uniref:hypothetical protein n=1 Tax=Streptomyces sp. NPDC058985 TaxID=3346684 RepID=UPI001F33140E|nr:hypothetical protein [Streptomyces sp. STD 3.1]
MRSARMLLTTAAASAVVVLGAPGAYAASAGDWDHDDSSYSKEHDNGSKHEKPHGGMHTGGGALTAVNEGGWDGGESKKDDGEKSWEGGKHEKPHGGMHTGGGALTAVNEWDGGESKKDEGSEYKQDEGEKSWGGGDHEKPRGGMHTGGGGLDTPTTTAGGLAVLGVAGAGLYAVRRKKSVNGMA